MKTSVRFDVLHMYNLIGGYRDSTRAASIPGIGIASIPAIFDGIGIGQVSYTSTNSVDCTLLTMK